MNKSLKIKTLANIRWSEIPDYMLDDIIDVLGIKLPPNPEEVGSTKYCPKCHNTHLLLLQTFNKKICTDCDTVIPWFLDKKQKPLL
jgi:hypothetical protein